MKKILSLLAAFGVMFYLSSCSDDDDDPIITFDDVEVTGPTGVTTLENGQTGATASFAVSVDDALTANYAVTTSGDVTVTSDATGAVSGTTVAVTFDAGTTAGSASIILTVTDSEGDVAVDEANFIINEVGDNAPTIAGIPTNETITEGEVLTVAGPITLTSEDGFAASNAFTLSIDGGAAADLGVAASATSPVSLTDVAIDATAGLSVGNRELVFTLTDADGDAVSFTHILTVEEPAPTPVVSVRGEIEEDATWTADNIYQLDTRVTVLDGVTLTIMPGTVIKGNEGQGSAATALLVAKGGTLNAEGTAALPIIFTSILDPIDPADIAAGNFASATSATEDGLWGGVIILGNASITGKTEDEDGNLIADNLTELQIEGIPASDENGLYGGSTDTDNSGTISYISIRHGGTNIGAGNEINGLTLGAVGSGTTISNVEVVANADDGIEFFGGDVSIDGAVVWNSFDDSMDSDQDWNGTVENFIIVTPQTGSAFELDGPEGSNTRGTNHLFTEGVVYVGDNVDHIVDWDGDTNATLTNIYFFGVESGNIETFGGNGAGTNDGWETDLSAAGTFFDGVPGASIAFDVAVGAKSSGPVAADFAWTWAGNSGALADLGL